MTDEIPRRAPHDPEREAVFEPSDPCCLCYLEDQELSEPGATKAAQIDRNPDNRAPENTVALCLGCFTIFSSETGRDQWSPPLVRLAQTLTRHAMVAGRGKTLSATTTVRLVLEGTSETDGSSVESRVKKTLRPVANDVRCHEVDSRAKTVEIELPEFAAAALRQCRPEDLVALIGARFETGNAVMSDFHRLTRMASDGCMESFTRLFEPVRPALLRQAEQRIPARIRHHVSADDVVQDTFIKAQNSIYKPTFESETAFVAWLRKVLDTSVGALERRYIQTIKRGGPTTSLNRNLAQTESGRDVELQHLVPGSGTSPDSRAAKNESMNILYVILDQLSEKDRQLIQVCVFEGVGSRKAAVQFGMTEDALRKALQRAREQVLVIARRHGLVEEE